MGHWNGMEARRLRRALDLTQKAVERRTGIYCSCLSLFEHGWRTPSPDQIRKLAKLYRCPLAALYRKARVQ